MVAETTTKVRSNMVTVYSNFVTLTTPFFLTSPSITGITGLDASLRVQLSASGNSLTNGGGDQTEFLVKRQSDNLLFWIVMPYVASGLYTLVDGSLVNQDTYTVACMYQPSTSNANYSAPSAVSNSMTGTPSNIPNQVPGAVTGSSVGTDSYDARFTWSRSTDFNEWSDSFYIHLKLTSSTNEVTELDLAANLDVTEHTFTGLDAGKTYKCGVDYHNDFGEGALVESTFVSLTKKPQAPTLTNITENDGAVVIDWAANADSGQTALTGFKIFRDAVQIATLAANVFFYNSVGLGNGNTYYYTVIATNAIGDSALSNQLSGIPYGPMSIVSAIPTGKTLSVTINPNGRPCERIIMLGLDDTATEELSNVIFDIPQNQISQTTTSNIVVAKTFSALSGNVTWHLVVAHCNSVVDFVKSA
jgi:hypothetical protein